MSETRRMVITVQNYNGLGNTSVALPDTDETVEITVDWEKLAKFLGPRAVRNKNGKAELQGMSGSAVVVARHVRRKGV